MKGRKPKSAEEIRLNGNAGEHPRYRLKRTTGGGARVRPGAPPPDGLNEAEAKVWTETITALGRADIKEVDSRALAAFCTACAMLDAARAKWHATGELWITTATGHIREAPWTKIIRDATTTMRTLAETLGLTPVSRTRLLLNSFQAARAGALAPVAPLAAEPTKEAKAINGTGRKRREAKPPPLADFLAGAPDRLPN